MAQGRTHPLAGFLYGCVGQAHHVQPWQAGGEIHLHRHL